MWCSIHEWHDCPCFLPASVLAALLDHNSIISIDTLVVMCVDARAHCLLQHAHPVQRVFARCRTYACSLCSKLRTLVLTVTYVCVLAVLERCTHACTAACMRAHCAHSAALLCSLSLVPACSLPLRTRPTLAGGCALPHTCLLTVLKWLNCTLALLVLDC